MKSFNFPSLGLGVLLGIGVAKTARSLIDRFHAPEGKKNPPTSSDRIHTLQSQPAAQAAGGTPAGLRGGVRSDESDTSGSVELEYACVDSDFTSSEEELPSDWHRFSTADSEPAARSEDSGPQERGGAPAAVCDASTQTALDVFVTEEAPPSRDVPSDPCESVCRFTNLFYNCWMNASLQAVLNLEVVREKFGRLPPEYMIRSSITPEFGRLFLTALTDPGTLFNSVQLFKVLSELSMEIPSLPFAERNDPLDFLHPLLIWLNQSGVCTRIQEVSGCEQCGDLTPDTPDCSNIYFLPTPDEHQSISSLVMFSLNESQDAGQCSTCGATEKKRRLSIAPDVLILYLPRTAEKESASRKAVTPCAWLEIPVFDSQTQTYRLASVICHVGVDENAGHFWTYLFKDGVTVQANDADITMVQGDTESPKERSCAPFGVNCNGVIYFYERCPT